MIVARDWGEEKTGSGGFMGIEVQFCKMKSAADQLYNDTNILNTTEPYS